MSTSLTNVLFFFIWCVTVIGFMVGGGVILNNLTQKQRLPFWAIYALIVFLAGFNGWYLGHGHPGYGRYASVMLTRGDPLAIAGMSMQTGKDGEPEAYFLFFARGNKPPLTIKLLAADIVNPDGLKLGDVLPMLVNGKWKFRF